MRLRKTVRIFAILLISIFGFVVLFFTFLNLPFMNGTVTKKTNQILSRSNLPVHIGKVRTVLPYSIKIEGIVIADRNGDTIIHVGTLRTTYSLIALMRKKLVLKDLELNKASADLLMNYTTREYYIAEAFSMDKNPQAATEGAGKSSFEISIRKGNLTSIHFLMADSISGMSILQDISGMELKKFSLSLADREIAANTLKLDNAVGHVTLGSYQSDMKDEKEAPWSLRSKAVDFKDIDLSIRKESVPGLSLTDLNMKLKDLRFRNGNAGVKIENLSFTIDNGFTVKDIKGELDSDPASTKLNLAVETGYSHIYLEGMAEQDLPGIVSAGGETGKARLAISESSLSLKDLAYFVSGLTDHPAFNLLARQPYFIEGDISKVNSAYSFKGININQEQNFHLNLEGEAEDPFRFSRARGTLHLALSGINVTWLKEVLAGFGINEGLPESEIHSLESTISGYASAPEFNVKLISSSGNLEGSGSVDFNTDRFSVHSSFDRVLLGEILNNPEFGSFTGSAEVTGRGFTPETMHANFSVLVDAFSFHEYRYQHASITGSRRPNEYEAKVQVMDSSIEAHLSAVLNTSDSIFTAQASGSVFARLHELHLLEDTLSVETTFAANVKKSDSHLDTELNLSKIALFIPGDSATMQQIDLSFKTDTLKSVLRAGAGFFQMQMMVAKPASELSSLIGSVKNYLATFPDPQNTGVSTRVRVLPEIEATGNIGYHPVLGMLTGDTSLHFDSLDLSLIHSMADDRLRFQMKGTDLAYRGMKTGKLNSSLSDSAGTVQVQIAAEDNFINNSPANRLMLNSRFYGWESRTELTVYDKQDSIVYGLNLASETGGNRIVLTVPSRQLILNRELWQMDTTSLLSVNLDNWKILPNLRMHNDSSGVNLASASSEDTTTYKGILSNVALSSVLQEGLISGEPAGSISGSIEYRLTGQSEKQLKSDLQFSDVSWSGLNFQNILVNGMFRTDSSKAYDIDYSARMDSSGIVVKGNRNAAGNGDLQAEFTSLPINTIQPFVRKHVSDLGGSLSGNFNLSTNRDQETINGNISITDGTLRINTLNAMYRIPQESVRFSGQKVVFEKFRVVDSLNNELLVDGFLDVSDRLAVSADLEISSSKLQVMNREAQDDIPFYGNIFVDSRLTVKGPLSNPDIKGNIFLTRGTEVFYRYMEDLSVSETERIITFVNQSTIHDQEAEPPIKAGSTILQSSIETLVEIDPAATINFELENRIYHIDVMIKGGGSLNYQMLNNNQVALTGKYEIRDGSADVKLIGWPNKSFRIVEGGFIRWEGMLENPELSVEALNKVSSSYTSPMDGKRRNVDFNVILNLSNRLSDLDVSFSITTSDPYLMSIINTLSPDEQMRQAIAILLFEYIDLPGISSSSDYMSQQVNHLLASQLNQLTKTTIQGVDISFGIDSYVQSTEAGAEEAKTSLSYEVKKSFLNNRAQVEFSGRLNDFNQQQGDRDFSLNNLSFEYRLDSAATKFIKIYNEHSYEDVFTGEVVKTGVGFTYRKRYQYFRDIWRRNEKNRQKSDSDK